MYIDIFQSCFQYLTQFSIRIANISIYTDSHIISILGHENHIGTLRNIIIGSSFKSVSIWKKISWFKIGSCFEYIYIDNAFLHVHVYDSVHFDLEGRRQSFGLARRGPRAAPPRRRLRPQGQQRRRRRRRFRHRRRWYILQHRPVLGEWFSFDFFTLWNVVFDAYIDDFLSFFFRMLSSLLCYVENFRVFKLFNCFLKNSRSVKCMYLNLFG